MSTFRGLIAEFPDIRVDFFRKHAALRPPRACFLSHIHSDHLAGLEAESFKAPFIYCSAATREILLRLEKQFHRVNFANRLLETRKQTYRHLHNLLRPIPLETPTQIELEPGNVIQVTLFDANHCPGAVMFLFEGAKNAVLYTGDIRSEPWMVNGLIRNPFLIEYTSGLKTLDCIYLDTTNMGPAEYPSKADGLKELVQKVSRYPPDTTFHFDAWTYGYEEVWMALSKALKSPIHVDKYKMGIFQSLRGKENEDAVSSSAFLTHEGPALTGYRCGNTPQDGCLTLDQSARIHSCEKGMNCSALDANTVWIRPIMTRGGNGEEISEIGMAGGSDDLAQHLELEFDSEVMLDQLMALMADEDDKAMVAVKRMLCAGFQSTGRNISLKDVGLGTNDKSVTFAQLASAIAKSIKVKRTASIVQAEADDQNLPKLITFPYSRHSSYPELCDLVKVFEPRDVYPCVVDEAQWHEDNINIKQLFGHLCCASTFRHDVEMAESFAQRQPEFSQQTHTTSSQTSEHHWQSSPAPVTRYRMISPARGSPSAADRLRIRRNSSGQQKAFDMEGKEVARSDALPKTSTPPPRLLLPSTPAKELSSLGSASQLVQIFTASPIRMTELTPPPNLTAVSPDSASQNLKRKALADIAREGGVKLLKFGLDGTDLPAEADSGHESRPQGVPRFEAEDQPTESEYISEGYDEEGHSRESVYATYDGEDHTWRCGACQHELWARWDFCTNDECKEASNSWDYWEMSPAENNGYFDVEDNGDLSEEHDREPLDGERRRELVGDYLDDESSAYDSQDEAEGPLNEEYEVNSFIDDDGDDEDEDADSGTDSDQDDQEGGWADEDGVDYKAELQALQGRYSKLLIDFSVLSETHEVSKRETLSVEYEELDNEELDVDTHEGDEDGLVVVGAAVPDPMVTKIVLSQAQGQSQSSEVSEDRIRDRALAFEAAEDGAWHDISLVTVSDNHTYKEVEL